MLTFLKKFGPSIATLIFVVLPLSVYSLWADPIKTELSIQPKVTITNARYNEIGLTDTQFIEIQIVVQQQLSTETQHYTISVKETDPFPFQDDVLVKLNISIPANQTSAYTTARLSCLKAADSTASYSVIQGRDGDSTDQNFHRIEAELDGWISNPSSNEISIYCDQD